MLAQSFAKGGKGCAIVTFEVILQGAGRPKSHVGQSVLVFMRRNYWIATKCADRRLLNSRHFLSSSNGRLRFPGGSFAPPLGEGGLAFLISGFVLT